MFSKPFIVDVILISDILARAKELADFIKHGCDNATIEIEL